MIYKIKFEHHYNNDEEWSIEHECLINAQSKEDIYCIIKNKYPTGYITYSSIEKFQLAENEILNITPSYGAIG